MLGDRAQKGFFSHCTLWWVRDTSLDTLTSDRQQVCACVRGEKSLVVLFVPLWASSRNALSRSLKNARCFWRLEHYWALAALFVRQTLEFITPTNSRQELCAVADNASNSSQTGKPEWAQGRRKTNSTGGPSSRPSGRFGIHGHGNGGHSHSSAGNDPHRNATAANDAY